MFFIEDNTHGKRYDWGFGQHWDEDNITATTTQWTTPITGIVSHAEIYDRRYRFNTEQDLASLIFTGPANYTLGLEIAFFDLPTNAGKDARVSVYVDKLDFKSYGTCFGLLGCEFQGRDIFSQLVYGTRISIYIGIVAALVSVGLGLLVGLVSAYLGGVVDEALMRFTDALLVLPGLPLIIVLIAVLGTSVSNLIILIGFLGWMGFARVVRSQVLSLKERPFIEAAKAIGAGKSHIMFKHIVPNVMSLVYVTLATSVPGAIVAEAALSFLGYYDPSIMSWGRMLYDVQNKGSYQAYWWVLPPGICIAAISIAFILLGYALDEILNPRLRIRR
jgi:peptide/nickel transport system permease protein